MGKVIGFLGKKIGNIKLKWKMIFICFFSVTAILVCSLWGYHKIIQTYDETLYAVMMDASNYALMSISGKLDGYETLGEKIFRNDSIQKILGTIQERGRVYTSDVTNIRYLISMERSAYDYINYMVLIDEKTGTILGDTSYMNLNTEKKKRIMEAAEEKWGGSVWLTEYGKEAQMILTRKIMCIENLGEDTLATLVINIDIESLIQDSGILEQENVRCVLVDEEGNSLSSSGTFTNSQIREIYKAVKDEKFKIVTVGRQKQFAVYRKDRSEKWGYVYLSDYNEVFYGIRQNLKVILVVVLVCFLVVVSLNGIFTSNLMRGFSVLVQAFQAFSKDISGQEENEEYYRRKDEIGILYQQFVMMKAKVVQLIHDNYVMELKRKRAQVEMLETQIDPHFLYNTLQAIDWKAKVLRSQEISEMVESLSQILQLTLSNKRPCITVEEELDLTCQFVTIQKIRMDGELRYDEFVEPKLLTAMLPKLVIQPLVENGITHSMDAMLEVTHIITEVRQEEDNLAVYVKNNGSQFPDNLIRKLNTKEILPTGHGIGILNIDARIRLMYGENYGITFFNENEFAVAKLLIPYEGKGEEHV